MSYVETAIPSSRIEASKMTFNNDELIPSTSIYDRFFIYLYNIIVHRLSDNDYDFIVF